MAGGEAFYSPVTRSRSFRHPTLPDYYLHKYFSGLIPSLEGGTRWLEWGGVVYSFFPHGSLELDGVGYSTSPGQLGSDNTPAG